MISSYGKVYQLGHRAVRDIFDGEVVVQPKIDGSQCAFGVFNGELVFRSKRRQVPLGTPDKLFNAATLTAKRLHDGGKLVEGWVYRGEVVSSRRHNVLTYDRVPEGNIILFDVDTGTQCYVSPEQLEVIGEQVGLETVPALFVGEISTVDEVKDFLERESILGGPLEEGIVIKNYNRFGPDGKALMAKLVRKAFKEKHKTATASVDIIEQIIQEYTTEARWRKAIQHRKEDGELLEAPQDIGPLIGEIQQDVYEECKDEIAEKLFKHYWKQIGRGVTRGFPEWYKNDYLLDRQFDAEGT